MKTIYRLSILVFIILINFTNPKETKAQFDTPCPALTTPFEPLTTRNTITGNKQANGCLDGQGRLNTFPNFASGNILAGNQNSIYVSPACPIPTTGNCYFANFNVKVCFDATVTNGSPNITSAGQCQWTSADIGKKIFVTSLCSNTICGFQQATSSITILPSTQLTIGRIATVTDATHIIIDCLSPANCISPNASASSGGAFATVIYGTDDTTNLNTAWNAALLFNGCATLHLPSGGAFFNDKIFFNKSPSGACQSSDNIHTLSQVALLAYSLTVQGEGHGNTYLIPTPDMIYANCSPACIGGGAQGVLWKDLSISGFGQSLLGAGAVSGTLFSVSGGNGGGGLFHVDFSHWGNRNSPIINGINIPQYSQISNVDCTNFGGYCFVSAGNSNVQVENSHIGGGGFGCWNTSGGGRINSSNNIFDGPTQGNLCLDISAEFNSTNDHMEVITAPSGGQDVLVRSGGVFNAVNFIDNAGAAASISLQVNSGGIARLLNYRATIAHTTGLSNAGTIFDLGSNFFNGGITNTGSIFGSASITGTTQTAGNFSPGAGMGTSTFGTITGDSRHGQVTITYAGALTATPIFTMTFPTTFFVVPTCTLQDVAGTNPFPTQIANGAITTTAVTFNLTFAVAPTAANTDVFVWNCSN